MEEKSAWSLGPEQAQNYKDASDALARLPTSLGATGGVRVPQAQGWSVWDSSTLWKPA